jgi:hypothetical protein
MRLLGKMRAFVAISCCVVASLATVACTTGTAGSRPATASVASRPALSDVRSPASAVSIYAAMFVDDVLSQPEFYTDSNLHRLFGEKARIEKVTELSFGSVRMDVQIPLFVDSATPAPPSSGSASLGALLLKDRTVRLASLRLKMGDDAPTVPYEYVAETFRFDRLAAHRMPPLLPAHGPLDTAPPTHPHGNQAFAFEFVDGSITRNLAFSFRRDGTLLSVYMSVDGKLP